MEYGDAVAQEAPPEPKEVLEIYSDDPAKIGYAIRKRRESLGLNSTTVAERAGISQAQVSRLENGKQGFRSARLGMLARALGISIVVHYGE